MNWDYISGFFDADGSITFIRNNSNKHRTCQLTFSNNELKILEQIEIFVYAETGCRGSIITKKPIKSTHNTNYELKYVYLPKTVAILRHMQLLHPKKKTRSSLVLEQLEKLTPRNGKYTPELEAKRNLFIETFFST
jgi:hypothetical protein